MRCVLLCTHIFLLLLLFIVVDSQDANISLGSCQDRCGNVSIPYPFGIGKGCYINDWFQILCNKVSTSGILVPYLPKINKQVVGIYLPKSGARFKHGSLRVKNNITSRGCSSSHVGIKFGEPLNFTGTPFTIGRSNKLMAVGCDNKATLTYLEPRLVGCISTCISRTDYDRSRCDGFRCCEADTPEEIRQVIGVGIEGIEDNPSSSTRNLTTQGGCRVAFLSDETEQYQGRDMAQSIDPRRFYEKPYATIQLRWVIPFMNDSFIKSRRCDLLYSNNQSTPCICFDTINYKVQESSCRCKIGYTGNPYLLDGCRDIDECELYKGHEQTSLNCGEDEICVNTPGSYRCVTRKNKTLPVTIGLSVGFGVLIATGVSFWLYKFVKRRRKINRKKKFFKRNGGLLLQQQLNSRKGAIEKTIVFSLKELKKATENFSSNRVLGQGGQGTVYKGMLVDGRIVAVKKSTAVDEDKLEEFINEVVILSQINHRNIVKILGCCLETQVPLLVYEFIPNGNLFEHLHDESDDYTMATWEVRLRIAIDIAGALSYLHSAASSPIYHRDIKSTNIMLDEKYRAKVSDFGTSRSITVDHTHLTTVVSGTAGYVDPEYFQSSQFTDKSDVYSFGVVLAELITGEKPVSLVRFQENRTLATYFILAMKDNKLVDTIDPRIKDDCKQDQVMETAKLARRCLYLNGKKRPSMREVSIQLEKIGSPAGGSHDHIVENNVDEVPMRFNIIGVESCNNVGATAPLVLQDNVASTWWLDAQHGDHWMSC